MKKQLISFTDRQAAFIESESSRLETSQADMVRRALDWYMDTYPGELKIEQATDNSEAIIHRDKP